MPYRPTIENRWKREQETQDRVRDWVKNGGPSPFGSRGNPFLSIREELFQGTTPLTYFGLGHGATRDDIMKAFRDMAKAAHDGKGGYKPTIDKDGREHKFDMDEHVQNRDAALEYIKRERTYSFL